MTDEEVICEWMEPRPAIGPLDGAWSPDGWWRAVIDIGVDADRVIGWIPRRLALDHLHEVEERLSDEQWQAYREDMAGWWQRAEDGSDIARFYLHATPFQKIRSLAQVIRTGRRA